MKNKSKGFTLVEVIIAAALLILVLGIIFTIFKANNGILSNVDIKSTLQEEGEIIQSDLSSIGMQSTGISDCVTQDGVSVVDKSYSEFNSIQSTKKIGQVKLEVKLDTSDIIYNFKYDESSKTLSMLKGSATSGKTLSTNVESFNIKTIDTNNNNLRNATYVEFDIKLKKKMGFTEVEYPVSVVVNFRNKNNDK